MIMTYLKKRLFSKHITKYDDGDIKGLSRKLLVWDILY